MIDTTEAPVDALAALRWLIEAGADEAVDDTARNRLETPAVAPRMAEAAQGVPVPSAPATVERNAAPDARPAAPAKRPAAVPIELESPDAALANARALAASCATLDDLKAAMTRFDGCSLRHTAKHLVFADGNPRAPVMFVGEAPGADEDREGRPFVGVSGQLLDRMMGAIGLDRTSAYITNIIAWRPPGNRKPTSAEVTTCLPFVERHIELVNPKVLVLVGGTAASALLQRAEGITRLRGKWLQWKDRVPTLALYHPAYLLRTPAQKRQAWQDLQALRKKLTELGV